MTTHTSRNAMHGYLKHLLFPQNNQHADYRLVNPYNTAKRRTWVPEAFTLSQKIVNALIIGSFTHTPRKAYFMPICFTRCSNSSLSQMALFLILAR